MLMTAGRRLLGVWSRGLMVRAQAAVVEMRRRHLARLD